LTAYRSFLEMLFTHKLALLLIVIGVTVVKWVVEDVERQGKQLLDRDCLACY